MNKQLKLHLGSGEDYREGYVNVDVNKKIKADVYCDFVKKLPFKNNSVDYVLCRNVFEHVPDPLSFLLEIKRVLKKGGKATIITSNASYFIYHFPRKKAYHDSYNLNHPPEDQHYFLFQPGHLKAFTNRAGMKLLKLDYYIVDQRRSRNNLFQSFMAYLIGRKFAYSDFLWQIEKQ